MAQCMLRGPDERFADIVQSRQHHGTIRKSLCAYAFFTYGLEGLYDQLNTDKRDVQSH